MSGKGVTPSRMNLQIYKKKVVAAKKGHSLLKKKLDALKMKFRDVMVKLIETKKYLGTNAVQAFESMANAEYALGGFSVAVGDAVGKKAQVKLNEKGINVAGVKLPQFEMREGYEADNAMDKIG